MESASGESRIGRLESLSAGGPGAVAPLGDRTDAFRVVTGNAGDHKLIHALLRAANQSPSYEDFLTWLDEPTYEPSDRLLVKHGGQIVAHVQVLDRLAWFGGVRLSVAGLQDLATLPEYREAGYDRLLLADAEKAMRDRQAVVAYARTDRPDAFRAAGWCEAHDQRATEANPHEILALLTSTHSPSGRRGRSLRTRLWRHVELDALESLYRGANLAAWGALDRAEPYWRWLVNRKAHSELIVAVRGKDDWSELDSPAHIVGYAVMRGARLVEFCMQPGYASTAPRLLVRACQDAIEQGHRELSLHLPANDPLHSLMLSAGGQWSPGSRCGTLMLKLLDPIRWVENIYPILLARAKAACYSRPLQFAFDTGRRTYRLELTRRSGHLMVDNGARADVACTPDVFGALLLGNLDVSLARTTGELEFQDAALADRVAALFPPIPFWQSQFDALRF